MVTFTNVAFNFLVDSDAWMSMDGSVALMRTDDLIESSNMTEAPTTVTGIEATAPLTIEFDPDTLLKAKS